MTDHDLTDPWPPAQWPDPCWWDVFYVLRWPLAAVLCGGLTGVVLGWAWGR